jgi:hypothetical protein
MSPNDDRYFRGTLVAKLNLIHGKFHAARHKNGFSTHCPAQFRAKALGRDSQDLMLQG